MFTGLLGSHYACSHRHAVVLVRGRASDVLRARPFEGGAVASVLGYPPGTGQDRVRDYRRAARGP